MSVYPEAGVREKDDRPHTIPVLARDRPVPRQTQRQQSRLSRRGFQAMGQGGL